MKKRHLQNVCLLYSTNNSCLEDRIDFTDLDAPTFENDDAGNEPEVEELISCIESSTVLKHVAMNIGESENGDGFSWPQATNLIRKNIPCLKRIVMIREGSSKKKLSSGVFGVCRSSIAISKFGRNICLW